MRKAELNEDDEDDDGALQGILDLLDDNARMVREEPEAEPAVEVTPNRRLSAVAWVIVVIAAMILMCSTAVLTFAFFLLRAKL